MHALDLETLTCLSIAVTLSLSACADEDHVAGFDDESANTESSGEDGDMPTEGPLGEGDETEYETDPGDVGGEDESCPEVEPSVTEVIVEPFVPAADASLYGEIRFETSAGRVGEIRILRGGISAVEFHVDDELVSATTVNFGAIPGGAVGGACREFPSGSVSTEQGEAAFVWTLADDGTLNLFDDALEQAMQASPEIHEAIVAGTGAGDLGCPAWCHVAGAGAGAAIGGSLAASGGFTPPALIGGGVIGVVSGRILGFECIDALCD